MKKPSNRKERMEFILLKLGADTVQSMYAMTDKEVKFFFDSIYPRIKDRDDYYQEKKDSVCIRCNTIVETEFHTWCSCGEDRAIYTEFDWKDDIDSNSDRVDGDMEFINNGCKLIN